MKFSRRHLKHSLLFVLCFACFITHNYSQTDAPKTKSDFWKHVRFGGGLGLGTGNGFFSATLAPSAIYEFNSTVALGIGLNGTYNSRKNLYKSTIIGGSILALFNPIREIQLSGELEELNVSRNYESNLNLENENYWYPALFVGAGYRSRNVTIGVRYDVLYDEDKSIYAEPWVPFVRVFF